VPQRAARLQQASAVSVRISPYAISKKIASLQIRESTEVGSHGGRIRSQRENFLPSPRRRRKNILVCALFSSI